MIQFPIIEWGGLCCCFFYFYLSVDVLILYNNIHCHFFYNVGPESSI